MEYIQDVENAEELAESTLAKLKDLGLAANPNNFTVWYNYFSETLPDLTGEIDKLLDAKDVPLEQCEALHERFFGNDAETAIQQKIWERMKTSMAEAIEDLSLTGSEAAQFGDSIMDAANGLSSDSDPSDILKMVEGVVDGARQIQSRTKELEIKLTSTTEEVGNLRDEMETERRDAGLDSLTGIANRKTFDSALRAQATSTLEKGEAFSLFFIHLDFLEDFNKRHGKNIGDQAIKLVAATLQRRLAETATPARYGGDKFAVILPQADLQAASEVANDVCQTLSTNTIVNRKNEANLGSIDVLIGVSQYELGEPIARLVSRVDDVLQVGSNKVAVAEPTGLSQNIAFA